MAHSRQSRHTSFEDSAAFAGGKLAPNVELPPLTAGGRPLSGSLGRFVLSAWLLAFLALSLFIVWDLFRGFFS
jgi:hypothetical protein